MPSTMSALRWWRFCTAVVLALLGYAISAAAVTSPVGLMNMGNTCYMNAQLQCAFHVPAFRHLVTDIDEDDMAAKTTTTTKASAEVKNEPKDIDDGATAETLPESDSDDDDLEPLIPQQRPPPPSIALVALRKVFLAMSASSRSPVSTREFCRQLGIPVMTQQDSQEFFKLLLPALESDRLINLYRGYFVDYIRALDGSGRVKERKEQFLDLSLDISKHTCVVDSLRDMFGEPEILSVADGNGWRPEKGADKVDAQKGASLPVDGLPSVLQLHLKRFNYDWQTDKMTKVNTKVSFPETLCLDEICVKNDDDVQKTHEEDCTTYDLQSVVIHAGQYGVGHYYSYVRPDMDSDQWFRFNDIDVQSVSFQDVLDDAFGGGRSGGFLARIRHKFRRRQKEEEGTRSSGFGGDTSSAYVLQYIKRSDRGK